MRHRRWNTVHVATLARHAERRRLEAGDLEPLPAGAPPSAVAARRRFNQAARELGLTPSQLLATLGDSLLPIELLTAAWRLVDERKHQRGRPPS